MANLTDDDVRRLFDAYEAADSDEARAEIRAFIADNANGSGIVDLYPQTCAGFEDTDVAVDADDIDADEIVEELKEIQDDEAGAYKRNDEVGIDEAREVLNDQAPSGGVVEAGEPMYGELYVYDPDMSADLFEPPAGWRTFETDNGNGIGFTRSEEPRTVDELFDYFEDLHGDNELFHVTSRGSADYDQLYYMGDKDNLPDGWVVDTEAHSSKCIKHADPQ